MADQLRCVLISETAVHTVSSLREWLGLGEAYGYRDGDAGSEYASKSARILHDGRQMG